jgi:hypothetical protein
MSNVGEIPEASPASAGLSLNPHLSGGLGSRPLWPWFLGGFLAVYVGMMFAGTTYIHPSGRFVVVSPRWQFDRTYSPEMLKPVRTMGPASSTADSVPTAIFVHGLLSVAGGGVAVAIGSCVRRVMRA